MFGNSSHKLRLKLEFGNSEPEARKLINFLAYLLFTALEPKDSDVLEIPTLASPQRGINAHEA